LKRFADQGSAEKNILDREKLQDLQSHLQGQVGQRHRPSVRHVALSFFAIASCSAILLEEIPRTLLLPLPSAASLIPICLSWFYFSELRVGERDPRVSKRATLSYNSSKFKSFLIAHVMEARRFFVAILILAIYGGYCANAEYVCGLPSVLLFLSYLRASLCFRAIVSNVGRRFIVFTGLREV